MNIGAAPEISFPPETDFPEKINRLDRDLAGYFSGAFAFDKFLTRKIVSFQSNKKRRYYKFYKYKEAFSSELAEYLFRKYHVPKGKILDPFAGAGTALFACSEMGYDADGIELLPVGQKIIEANIFIRNQNKRRLSAKLRRALAEAKWNDKGKTEGFEVLRITNGAYPKQTEYKIKRFLHNLRHEEEDAAQLLLFALLCVLESISYTRKDGQFLRWDRRSGRAAGANSFDKGGILPFDQAIKSKIKEIIDDMSGEDENLDLFSDLKRRAGPEKNIPGKIRLLKGSCLDLLPKIKAGSYSGIITSPPYCNRYDYTRTYALELALLGAKERDILALRQSLLSCTVENKIKDMLSLSRTWEKALDICGREPLLREILSFLDYKKSRKELNNNGIARMIKGYFYELACVIQECQRVLKPGGYMFMANDNVRYAGVSISVDMICSKIAESLGFQVENILTLPQGKGNSSQQMGRHGRSELRKCVYVWKKNKINAL